MFLCVARGQKSGDSLEILFLNRSNILRICCATCGFSGRSGCIAPAVLRKKEAKLHDGVPKVSARRISVNHPFLTNDNRSSSRTGDALMISRAIADWRGSWTSTLQYARTSQSLINTALSPRYGEIETGGWLSSNLKSGEVASSLKVCCAWQVLIRSDLACNGILFRARPKALNVG
jgi:hypothetical protein